MPELERGGGEVGFGGGGGGLAVGVGELGGEGGVGAAADDEVVLVVALEESRGEGGEGGVSDCDEVWREGAGGEGTDHILETQAGLFERACVCSVQVAYS